MKVSPRYRSSSPRTFSLGFTLVELLVSMAILALLMVIVLDMLSQTQNTVTRQQSRAEEYREARAALESLSRNVSTSVMNAYWAYGDSSAINKVSYTRQSDSHFVSGPASVLLASSGVTMTHGQAMFFQTADGYANPKVPATGSGSMPNFVVGSPYNLITCMGYYIDYGSDLPDRPNFLAANTLTNPERKRFRLMEFRLPAEKNVLYSPTLKLNAATTPTQAYQWFRGPYSSGADTITRYSSPLADNVLALILQPRYIVTTIEKRDENKENIGENSTTVTRLAENYTYDSREHQWGGTSQRAVATTHQLPPVVQVTILVAEERAYAKASDKLGGDRLRDDIVNLFTNRFTDHLKYQDDMEVLQEGLIGMGISHRVFTTNVTLRGSKWVVEDTLAP